MKLNGWPVFGAALCVVSGVASVVFWTGVGSWLWGLYEHASWETQVGVLALGWVLSFTAAGVAVVLTWEER